MNLEPEKFTLVGNRVMADVIKVRIKVRLYWIKVGPESNETILMRQKRAWEGRDRQQRKIR